MRINMQDTYVTSDFGLATALVVAGVVLVDIDRTNPRRAGFVFQNDGAIDGIVESYRNDTLTVPAQTFFEATRRMKARLYE